MLLLIANYLTDYVSGFNVFTYITMRAIMSALTALLISLLMGPLMIRRLSTCARSARPCAPMGPKRICRKPGTPTMGGALILVAILVEYT